MTESEAGDDEIAQLESSRSFQMSLVLKIMKADLTKNFDKFGRMDPFAVVEWRTSDDSFVLSKTRKDWNSHMNPVWEHTCRPRPFEGNETIRIEVFDANMVSQNTPCGHAEVQVAELISGLTGGVPSPTQAERHNELKLPLKLNKEDTGTVVVQAMVVPIHKCKKAELTKVDSSLFETPVKRLGVSGGTAPFFKLHLKDGRSPSFYIGKDLSRASDEVDFYEEVQECRQTPSAASLLPLFEFTFDYAGILKVHEEGKENKKPLDLLVLRNLHDGMTKLRLLDIKIGQKTAQAGWQGKSRAAALRQAIIDGHTNSAGEGFRLEGFDGQPETLKSLDPLLDLGHGSEKMAKKAMRIMLQRMHAATMLLYLVDLQDLPPPSQVQLTNTLSQSEMAEIVLHEMVRRLARLSIACVKCSVPQKWIGSSVALGFDVGELTKRGEEEQLREKVIVSIFDWGRSELNTLEKHADLSAADQADRHEYWQYYVGGIMRLSLEVTRAYFQRFGNAGTWDSVAFMIYDFDSMSENDFMGKVEVPLEETKEMTEHVTFNPRMNRLASGVASFQRCCWKKKAKLTYSIEWVSHPSFSRLAGVWRVKLIRAVNLPREDLMMIKGSSDPLVEVIAHSADGFCFRQRSSSKIRSLNPEWNEVFEVPVTRSADTLQEALAESGVQLPSDLETGQLLPPEKTKAEMLMEAGGRKRRASVSSLCSEEVVQERKESGEMTSHQQSLNERKRKQAWVSLITAAAEAQSVTKQESRLPEEVRLGAARIVADTEDVLLRRENIVACDTVWKVEGDEGKPEGECCAAAEGCRFM
mmetsp:Transcript_2786/g.6618  ORF Transcript_2786/g.6618 Transcript_2786/m.6618 type:complete len:809 (-) Transcript_2786:4-2430(-)